MTVIAALYKFASLPDYKELRLSLIKLCEENNIKGSLLLAEEGINGTVAASREGIDALKNFLHSDLRFLGVEYKESFAKENPFRRMKVKLKKEIVTLGQPQAKPSEIVGTYVGPAEWNELIKDPEVTVIDVRNDYEVELGTFFRAINPKTDSFREFPDFVAKNLDPEKNKKIAMMCTGGIRCEKASSFMKKQGFMEVYHLKGGILQYLEDTPKPDSLWQGECFVFDNRVTVDHDLKPGQYELCHGCRFPIDQEAKASPLFEEGVSCPRCHGQRSEKQVESSRCRQKQISLAKKRGQSHLAC